MAVDGDVAQSRPRSGLRLIVLYVEAWLVARLLPAYVGRRDFRQILEGIEPRSFRRYAGLPAQKIAKAVKRTTRHPLLMRNRRCFREGLLGYRFLRMAGYRPKLHFSIRSSADRELSAHCWVVLDGKPIVNDDLEDMTTILIYPRAPSTADVAQEAIAQPQVSGVSSN